MLDTEFILFQEGLQKMRALVELRFKKNTFMLNVWVNRKNEKVNLLSFNSDIKNFIEDEKIKEDFMTELYKSIRDNCIREIDMIISSERLFFDTLIDKSIFTSNSKKTIYEEINKHYAALMKEYRLVIRNITSINEEKIIVYYFEPLTEREIINYFLNNLRKQRLCVNYDFDIIDKFTKLYKQNKGYSVWLENNEIHILAFYKKLLVTSFKVKGNSNNGLAEIASYLFALSEEFASTDVKIYNVDVSKNFEESVIKVLTKYSTASLSLEVIDVVKNKRGKMPYEIIQ